VQHIETTRLFDLSHEALICDPKETEHLRVCEECATLLRVFVRQHRLARELMEKAKKFKDEAA
jgi:hypothetical protein